MDMVAEGAFGRLVIHTGRGIDRFHWRTGWTALVPCPGTAR